MSETTFPTYAYPDSPGVDEMADTFSAPVTEKPKTAPGMENAPPVGAAGTLLFLTTSTPTGDPFPTSPGMDRAEAFDARNRPPRSGHDGFPCQFTI